MPLFFRGFFISYSEYQRFMVSAININSGMVPKL
jgi:hypothetical protein